ncbi:glutaminyl-peptide cyclotransferase [Pseudodesulfovibrio sp.]|uniref:glutaminyl-peptide cyclotransferase n=1 Tax=unclassified Pseudodesulfovibrio TaxID=2661612 RepID=UPI003AFFEDEF
MPRIFACLVSARKPRTKFLIPAVLLTALVLAPLPALAGAHTFPCRVIAQFPHDKDAFTEGLCLENERMYESSGGWGKSYLAEVDLNTGRQRKVHKVDEHRFAEGIVAANGGLYMLTWRSGSGSIYSLDDLSPIGSFDYRLPDERNEAWGLTFDGSLFLLSSGSDRLSLREPEDFSPVGEIKVHDGKKPVYQLNELEFVENMILANVWKQDRIAVIDPADGTVVAWIDLSPLRRLLGPGAGVANGIAYDRKTKRLFVTGKHWDSLFEIKADFNAWHRTTPDRE